MGATPPCEFRAGLGERNDYEIVTISRKYSEADARFNKTPDRVENEKSYYVR